jgi:HK97 family phage prohead protease
VKLPTTDPDARQIRSTFLPGALDIRVADVDGTAGELFGHFSTFNSWYEVDSATEGRYMERVLPGAFTKTIEADRSGMRCLFEHGFDPTMGSKPLGPITDLREDETGAAYTVSLLATDYNKNFIVPALEGRLMDGSKAGSQLGASFQFTVSADKWERGKVNSVNPEGLDRRSIVEAKVFEFGPVTFPVSAAASAGVRSQTDEYMRHLLHDGRFVADLIARTSPRVVDKMLDEARGKAGALDSTDDENGSESDKVGSGHQERHTSQSYRRAQALLIFGADQRVKDR